VLWATCLGLHRSSGPCHTVAGVASVGLKQTDGRFWSEPILLLGTDGRVAGRRRTQLALGYVRLPPFCTFVPVVPALFAS
jgi:hypothetical protein